MICKQPEQQEQATSLMVHNIGCALRMHGAPSEEAQTMLDALLKRDDIYRFL